MDDRLKLEAVMWKAARHLSDRLKAVLDDPNATSITFDRDEALLALGLIEGVVETLEREQENRP